MGRRTSILAFCLLATSSVSQGAFKFTAWADNRPSLGTTTQQNFHWVVLEMNRILGSQPAFHVVPGDYDYTFQTQAELNTYADVKGWDRIAGNHDTEDLGMSNYVSDCDNARFIYINEYVCPAGIDNSSAGRVCEHLLAWIEQQLVGAPRFVFVVGHEPAFPESRHTGDSLDYYPADRDAFWQLLNNRGVLAYICGHTHYYSTYSDQTGSTVQIDLGNAGNPGEPEQTFVLFDVTDAGYVDVTPYRGVKDQEFVSSGTFQLSPPQKPPQASLLAPADGGSDDLNPNPGEVTVNTLQPCFKIQLSDADGINDSTVTSGTVSIAGLTLNVNYAFAYDGTADVITLTPVGGAVFANGLYTITVSGIRDLVNEVMPSTVLTVRIDTSIVAPQTLRFQQGFSGYAGTADTMVCAGMPGTSFSTTSSLNVDTLDVYGGVSQVLLQFDGIVGAAADQIPPGAGISSATLRLYSVDTGNGGHLHAMLQPWLDTSTWNSLTNGVSADGVEASSVADGSVGSNSVGDVDFDVTGTVQDWVNGAMQNNGWVVLPNGADGWHIASCEYGTLDYRPELIVTFTPTGGGSLPPVANAGADQAVFDDDADGVVSVTLDGSASRPAASIVSYVWTSGSVEVAKASTPVAANVPFAAPGVYHVTLTVIDNTGLSGTDEVVITAKIPSLFSEDFESGGFSAGGWSTSGQATVDTTSAHTGTYGALLKRTSSVWTTINTAGLTGATVTYWARTAGLQNNESLFIEWSQDGSTWHLLNTLTGATGWTQSSHDIWFTAQPSFMIRFRTNGNAGSDMAMIDDIVVTGTAAGNTAPIASNDIATTNEDSPVTINVLANDIDPDGDALTVSIAAAPANGVAVVNADNTVTYTPAANYNGSDSFTYAVSDGRGGTASAAVTVTIIAVDDPAVAVNDAATTTLGTPVTISVLANDYHVDGPLTVASASTPSHGTATVNADGTITYTPVAGYAGTDSFTYTLVGGATATVTVTVQGATPTMHVAGIDGIAAVKGNSSQWAAKVTVTIVDQAGNPVSGATVAGAWSGAVSGASTVVTGSDGKVVLTSGNTKSTASITFTVTNVAHGSFTYDPSANLETSITVSRP